MNKNKLRRLERHKKFEEEQLMREAGVKIAIDSGKSVRIEAKETKKVSRWLIVAAISFAVALLALIDWAVG